MITLLIKVVARVGTRSTSYNVKDVERALRDCKLDPVRNTYLDSKGKTRLGLIFSAEQSFPDKETTLAARKKIEQRLKRVHRNISYRFEFEGIK